MAVVLCLVGYQSPGFFYRNLGAINLVHAVDVSKLLYIPEGVIVHELGLKRAVDYSNQSFLWDSKNLSTIRLLSMTAAAQGDWNRVTQIEPYLTSINPFDTMGNLLLGYAYWRMDRVGESVSAWRKAKAALFLFDYAAIHQRAGEGAEAIELYTLARQVDPNVKPGIESLKDIAWALYFSDRKGEAFTELSAGLNYPGQENWQKTIAFGEMGIYYLREGKWQDAVVYLREALALTPVAAQYRVWLGKAYLQQGNLYSSERELLQAISDSPNKDIQGSAYLILAQLYFDIGAKTKSRNACEKVIANDPSNLECFSILKTILIEEGDLPGAMMILEKMILIAPDNLNIRLEYIELKTHKQKVK